MRKLVVGILAHVDAGKTTLSESMLYLSGKIRKLGRVDNKDAYLDTYELEKARGITIFSKQALFEVGDTQIILLDTPGHVDFSAEMERTLQVLDYAILVVSGANGVQGHTRTLWRLLSVYKIPTFIFVNKMDQEGTDKDTLIKELKKQLNEGCIDFTETDKEAFYEEVALRDEAILECFLEEGSIETSEIVNLINHRKVFPCFFGSALRLQGVEEFMQGIIKYAQCPTYPEAFGAKVFKINRDDQGNRLTFMKITGGSLKVKTLLTNKPQDGEGLNQEDFWEEKVNQIRIYSGQKFEPVNEVEAGAICAVTGLTQTYPGEGLGIEKEAFTPLLEPVLSYRIILPEGCDPKVMLPKLRQIEEEEPELHIVWDENLQEIQVQIMGEVQIEILQSIIKDRFNAEVSFDSGTILYKETIANTVEGVGHFEPLRHYAEVHLILEPGPRGSGLQFTTICSEDALDKSWQRLILTHLQEKAHKGVLTGSLITDMKITLAAGRAHKKHTVGGDFREATYRAVRQGLKQAHSILLEPYYDFQLELPEKMVGRAMTDIEKLNGTCELKETVNGLAILAGSAPVVTMKNYQKEVTAYTKGLGKLFCSLRGYEPCHNAEQVIASIGYDSERDLLNPTGSVFCAHGSGFLVSWDEVHKYMHIESCLQAKKNTSVQREVKRSSIITEESIGLDEIDKIINSTFYANQGRKSVWKKKRSAVEDYYKSSSNSASVYKAKEPYLLVDGYNIIFAWEDLKELVEINIDAARTKLLDLLSNYQSIVRNNIIVVFDAYRVQGHPTEIFDYNNIHVIYTKEAETADQYIEKFVHNNRVSFDITVATSDSLEQIIIRSKGASLMSARELREEILRAAKKLMEDYRNSQVKERNSLSDNFTEDELQKFRNILKEDKN
ncbi:translation factor GTPase family protein [Clostridium thermarum]|uniref:translation factor GTPase family protein n=1 Tax=Clostridium thermarum TaxID=1716543 RepID=UPI0013D40E14|nr:TetM/TetW/TetO/TetS family tetracycline resistance ribosomal protection protein [Clostridium thermarum]